MAKTTKTTKKIVRKKTSTSKKEEPLVLEWNQPKFCQVVYRMNCPEGEYRSHTWLGLGWEVFTHRLWHLWHDKSFRD